MKILWVCPLFLHPTTKGGQIRTLEMLKQLHRRHEIHFAALASPNDAEGPERSWEYCTKAYAVPHLAPRRGTALFYIQALAGFVSSTPVAVSRHRSRQLNALLTQLLKVERFDVVVCDFLAAAPNVPNLKDAVLFQHNVETIIWERQAENARSVLRKALFRVQAWRMFRYERQVCQTVRQVIAVSKADSELMRSLFGIPDVQEVPTGVDVEYFARPRKTEAVADLTFVGSMDWLPNVDCIEFFCQAIWPCIQKQLPECRLAIVGRTPPRSILALAERDSRIQVTGTVPDVRPYLWGSRVSVVPLRIGGGTRIKIYEAMAAGLPVVSTRIGAEGLPLVNGETILLADDPNLFAQHCVDLIRDAALRERIGEAGRKLVVDKYSWDVAARCFEDLLTGNLQ